MITNFLLVAIGGFFGSVLRFFISHKLVKQRSGTWIANITGSLLLAYLLKLYINEVLPDVLWLLCGTGFCGAYTTFSTFGNETIQLLLAKKYYAAFYYVSSSFIVSISLVIFVLVS